MEGNVRSVTRIADNANAVNDKSVLPARNNVIRRNGEGEAVQVASVSDAGTAAEVSELSFPDAGEQLLFETVAKIAGSAQQAQQLLEGYFRERIATLPAAPRNDKGGTLSAGEYARGSSIRMGLNCIDFDTTVLVIQ